MPTSAKPTYERLGPSHYLMPGYGYSDVEVRRDYKRPAGQQWVVETEDTTYIYPTRRAAMARFRAECAFILAGLYSGIVLDR